MNEATQKMIEDLANKLGTTTEHLWGVLCRQAPISAVVGLACDAALLLIVVLAWHKLSRVKYEHWDNDFGKGVMYGGLALATAITVACALGALPTEIAGLVNPEYWALKQLLK
jgi:hypothetical protein